MEMTIPSVLDPTLAPAGCHVVSLFTQFTPYHIEGREWTEQDREAFADTGEKHKCSYRKKTALQGQAVSVRSDI